MNILMELFNEQQIKDIIQINNAILYLSEEELLDIINTLKRIGCKKVSIREIILTNPNCLSKIKTDIIKLDNKLKEIGIEDTALLYENNPYILNKDSYEIDEYMKTKQKEGLNIDEIVDLIETNSYEMNEV